jgi:hypothetical protein
METLAVARIGRPRQAPILPGDAEREELRQIAPFRSAPHDLLRWAQIVIASAAGEPNVAAIAAPTFCLAAAEVRLLDRLRPTGIRPSG